MKLHVTFCLPPFSSTQTEYPIFYEPGSDCSRNFKAWDANLLFGIIFFLKLHENERKLDGEGDTRTSRLS